jgi:hypothetical protein
MAAMKKSEHEINNSDETIRAIQKADSFSLTKKIITECLLSKIDSYIINQYVSENMPRFTAENVLIMGALACQVFKLTFL